MPLVHGIKLEVPGQIRECVQESTTETGQTISGSFVSDVNFIEDHTGRKYSSGVDVFDLSVVDPNLKTIYTVRRKSEHRFDIPADVIGVYSFCFYNQNRKEARVMYNAHVGHHVVHGRALNQQLDPLTESVQNAKEYAAAMKQEYHYQKNREIVHRRTNETTSHRVKLYSALEAFALIACSVFQVWYIRKLFSNRDRSFV
eukprot:CAMPEP_0198197896 /NCGR_PEP_ID=MMETSP1445-20131203/1471_1 /TAXON_ID=36898 /ORGANISM="Pyramimonas sp., Strain CCMP2087" /LENGTH=199 /DNA_ID=CAMNT_0043867315 /DNA_START=235 /DNA_END=834 /DNA_ORIENTATION=-